MHNLKRLIRMHPGRPMDCIKAIPSFTREERSLGERKRPKMDLYRFLKRATLRDEVFSFHREGIYLRVAGPVATTIYSCKLSELIKKLIAPPFKLVKGKAVILAEVLNAVSSDSGNLINFALHPMPSIMDAFMLFYSALEPTSEGEDNFINNKPCTIVRPASMIVPSSASQRIEELGYRFAVLCSDSRGNGLVSLLEVQEYLGATLRTPMEQCAMRWWD